MNFGRRIAPILIIVSGGTGSAKFNPGLSGLCLTRGITPPRGLRIPPIRITSKRIRRAVYRIAVLVLAVRIGTE